MLFFAEDLVYKVKKDVDFGFLDYTTLAQRQYFCEEEVRLNRRLAEDVYLGVVPITRDDDGVIRVRGDGETIEYAVEMKRLPVDGMLASVLERGEIDNRVLEAIAELLVRFHEQCDTGEGVDEHATPEALGEQLNQNFAQSRRFIAPAESIGLNGATITKALHAFLHEWCTAFLDQHRALFKQRIADSRVREGHGDLHAGNICLLPDKIVVYDCIEFTRQFRCRDVACEIGFLAMDLDARGYRGFARFLTHRYTSLANDESFDAVLPFYKVHLAFVRGKVASLRAADESVSDEEREEATREAARYFHLAASYTLPPVAILTCGLPAAGKSRLAQATARPFEAVVLRSDVIRKGLAGLQPTERGDDGAVNIYTAAFTGRTYDTLLERAVEALERGRSVVLDATFASRAQRDRAMTMLRKRSAPCVLVHLDPPESVIAERMRDRSGDASEVSDADWDVYVKARQRFESPEELAEEERVTICVPRSDEAAVSQVIDRLIGQVRAAGPLSC